MDSKHLILKEDAWLERLMATGSNCVTAYPNIIGHTVDGWLAAFQETHRVCLLADADYELVVFGERNDPEKGAFQKIRSWMNSHSLERYELRVILHD